MISGNIRSTTADTDSRYSGSYYNNNDFPQHTKSNYDVNKPPRNNFNNPRTTELGIVDRATYVNSYVTNPDRYGNKKNDESVRGRFCCASSCCKSLSSSRPNDNNSERNCFGGYGRGCFCDCYVNEESRPKLLTVFYNKVTKSIIWRFFHVLFAVFLLFGPAIQCIGDVGKTGDNIFMGLRIAMLLFFIVDMMIRCIAEDGYFVCSLCKGRGNNNGAGSNGTANNTSNNSSSNNSGGDSKDSNYAIGSFLFWCDLISTCSILYNLKFINKQMYQVIKKTIVVDFGIPVSDYQLIVT